MSQFRERPAAPPHVPFRRKHGRRPRRSTVSELRDAGEVLLLLHIGAAAGRFEHPQISLMAHEIPRQRPAVAAVPACLKELGGSAYREGLDGMTVLAEVAARSRADQRSE